MVLLWPSGGHSLSPLGSCLSCHSRHSFLAESQAVEEILKTPMLARALGARPVLACPSTPMKKKGRRVLGKNPTCRRRLDLANVQ